MVRFLYAGYLGFALYLIYPMFQDTLAASTACLHNIVPSDGSVASGQSASDAQAHKHDCVLVARTDAGASRTTDTH